jgi:outer membrane protein TolC
MRAAAWAACGVAFLLTAGGCVNNQAEVARYRAILNAEGADTVPPLRPGEELTLARALLLANQDNENLMIRGEDFIQALAEKDRAFAQFLPTISLQPGYTISHNPNAGAQQTGGDGIARPVGTSGGFKAAGRTFRRFEVPVTGSGNLFRGFRDVATVEANESLIEQRRQLLLDAQSTLFLDVATTYYTALRAERQVDVLTRSLEAQNERVRDAQGRLRAGTGRPLDLAQAEAQAASTRVTLVQAQGDATNARNLLAFLIGAGEVSGPLVDQYGVPSDLQGIEPLLAEAWQNREDYRAAQALVDAERHNVDAAIAQYYPSVTLNVTGYLFRENFENASKWNSLLSVNIPIFSAGLIEADVRTAWSRLRQAAVSESLLRRQIEQEVRERFQNFLTSAGRLRELDAQIRAATEAYRQARAGFQAGTAINLDVLTAQETLLNSQLEVATEEFNQKMIHLDLVRATGRLKVGTIRQAATRPTTAPTTAPTVR